MQISLAGLTKSNQLPSRPALPFLTDQEFVFEVSAGRTAIVTADCPCLLANLYYIMLGELLVDRGQVSIGGQRIQPSASTADDTSTVPLRPQDRGIGVVDQRSSLWWSQSLLQNVAGVLPDDEEAAAKARLMLDRCGIVQALEGAGLPLTWREQAKHEGDPEERARYLASADDVLNAFPSMLPDFVSHKRVELARELVQGPRLLTVLDSCDCAGQPNASSLYPLYQELAGETAGLLLFTRTDPQHWGFAEHVYRFTRGEEGICFESSTPEQYQVLDDKAPVAEDDVAFRLTGLSKKFGPVTVIEDITFEVERSRVTVIMGGSGCGKSTLLRMVAGIHQPTTGQVEFNYREDGQPRWLQKIVDPKTQPSREMRKAFGVLFQDGALFNSMTVAENVAAPILEHTQLHSNVIDLMVQIKLDLVAMWGNDPETPEHAHKLPAELSGGQRKRIGLARALALDPQVILYDEPSAGLDPIVSRQIDELIIQLGEVLGVTSIVITHELDSAFEIADKMVVLRKGNEKENEYWGPARMVAQGNREEITSCIHPHVIEFLEMMSYHRDMPLARYHKNWYSGICEAS